MGREFNKAFGEVIKLYRLNNSLSQEKLAEKAGFHRTYISLLERGIKNPTLDTVFKLAIAFDVNAFEIVRLVEEKQAEINPSQGK